jgi:hypothetical protein
MRAAAEGGEGIGGGGGGGSGIGKDRRVERVKVLTAVN